MERDKYTGTSERVIELSHENLIQEERAEGVEPHILRASLRWRTAQSKSEPYT